MLNLESLVDQTGSSSCFHTGCEVQDDEARIEIDRARRSSTILEPVQSMASVHKYKDTEKETLKAVGGNFLEDRDGDAKQTRMDKISYVLENAIAANPNLRFLLLFLVTTFLAMILGLVMMDRNDHHFKEKDVSFTKAMLYMAEFFASGGFSEKKHVLDIFLDLVGLFLGLVLFATLIGFITEVVENKMVAISEGKSKVCASGHTLILGWNEATVRVVIQIAFLRRKWQVQNETWSRRLMPWTRVAPSSPVAASPVIVMADTMTKEEMDSMLGDAMAERGIDPKRTRIGWDIVCRVGNPCQTHDLVRVNAHNATSIITMMTEKDLEEELESEGRVKNGASIRTILALRSVMMGNRNASHHLENDLRVAATNNVRIVLHLATECRFMDAACFSSPVTNSKLVFPMDLSLFLNRLLFFAIAQPGISQVLMKIIDLEGTAIRCRGATEMIGPDGKVGSMIGKTFKDILLNTRLEGTIIIGVNSGDRTPGNHEIGGIAPRPDYVVSEKDWIIFLSYSSLPKLSTNPEDHVAHEDPRPNLRRTLSRSLSFKQINHGKDFAKIAASGFDEQPRTVREPQRVLLCGWRAVWTSVPIRLLIRIQELSANLPVGSSITFLNVMEPDEFRNIMNDSLELEPAPDGSCPPFIDEASAWRLPQEFNSVQLYHHSIDCADFQAMKEFFDTGPMYHYHSAIVLGSAAKGQISGYHQDTRVLSVSLILRHICFQLNYEKAIHLSSENNEDQTAQLALAPKVKDNEASNRDNDPDFINTQAITARVLAIGLAYPQINDAMAELFLDGDDPIEGDPDIEFQEATHYGLVGKEVAFGVVQNIVNTKENGYAIAIGISSVTKGLMLAPAHSETHEYVLGDRLVIIIRKF